MIDTAIPYVIVAIVAYSFGWSFGYLKGHKVVYRAEAALMEIIRQCEAQNRRLWQRLIESKRRHYDRDDSDWWKGAQ